MSFFRNWLMGVTAAALAVSLAQALTPEGAVKKVGRLVGGLVLLLAVARPLLSLEPGALALPAVAIGNGMETEKTGDALMKELIAEKTEAYIVDKGSLLGCVCSAQVTVEPDENGWPTPWSAAVTGSWTEGQRTALSRAMEKDLGIPAQRQSFQEGEP